MTSPLHTNNLILLPYMAKTNVWRSRTAAGVDVATDLAEDRVYEGICDAAEGGFTQCF